MKKICYVTTIPVTLSCFVLESASYLYHNAGWDITFICDEDEAFKQVLPDYIHYIPVPMKRGISLSGISAMLKMVRIFKRENFDLVQYSTPNAALYASLASWLIRIPVRLYCQWGMVFVGFSGIKRKIFKVIEKLVCTLSTHIEPDSYSNLQFAQDEGLYSVTKGHVVWNGSSCGVDLKRFNIEEKAFYRERIRNKYGIPADSVIFGFVGRITRDKGINELLAASKYILEKFDNVYLLMIGSSEIDQNVNKKLYDWSQKEKRIIYVGHTDTVEQYFAAMDCSVLPSYREGMPMSVLEAQAMAVPVIVSDINGISDAFLPNRTGLVVKKADINTLYKAMKYYMENVNILSQHGKNAREYIEKNFERKKLFEYILNDRKKLMQEL